MSVARLLLQCFKMQSRSWPQSFDQTPRKALADTDRSLSLVRGAKFANTVQHRFRTKRESFSFRFKLVLT